MASIVPPAMRSVSPPDYAYSPDEDVVAWRISCDATVAQEVFRRGGNKTLGFRYSAWVNFTDAGGGAHHMWWTIDPNVNLVTDDLETAREVADAHASGSDVAFAGRWTVRDDA